MYRSRFACSDEDFVCEASAEAEEPAATDGEASEKTFTEQEINGVTVRFFGGVEAVTKAEWTDNGFDYAVVLTEESVTASVMTDYVAAIR